MIEEHERADVPTQPVRQQATHDETIAEVVKARLDDEFARLRHAVDPLDGPP
jgi:hypothetical protein